MRTHTASSHRRASHRGGHGAGGPATPTRLTCNPPLRDDVDDASSIALRIVIHRVDEQRVGEATAAEKTVR